MTLAQTLYCEGRDNSCWKAFVRTGISKNELYVAARSFGWQTRPGGPDFCPDCKEAQRNARRKPGTCPSCMFHVPVEFRDSLGHDTLGHRTANTLASHGIKTWDALLDLKTPTMRKLGGLGDRAQARIVWAQHHPKERFL